MKVRSGSVFYEKGNITAVVSPALDGVYPTTINQELLFEIGKLLALFHSNVTRLPHAHFVGFTQELFKFNLPMGIIHGDVIETNIYVERKSSSNIMFIF